MFFIIRRVMSGIKVVVVVVIVGRSESTRFRINAALTRMANSTRNDGRKDASDSDGTGKVY